MEVLQHEQSKQFCWHSNDIRWTYYRPKPMQKQCIIHPLTHFFCSIVWTLSPWVVWNALAKILSCLAERRKNHIPCTYRWAVALRNLVSFGQSARQVTVLPLNSGHARIFRCRIEIPLPSEIKIELWMIVVVWGSMPRQSSGFWLGNGHPRVQPLGNWQRNLAYVYAACVTSCICTW